MTVSREAQSIIDYVEACKVPHRVTDVYGPGHADGSYHYAAGTGGKSLAVDFGGVTPGVNPTTAGQMARIYRALLAQAGRLAELIYSGLDVDGRPVTTAVKNGRRVEGASFFGPAVWRDHFDHVHVAVTRGTFLADPLETKGDPMADQDPNVHRAQAPVVAFEATPTGKGYWIVTADGEVFAFGDAQYFGRVDGPQ